MIDVINIFWVEKMIDLIWAEKRRKKEMENEAPEDILREKH